MLFLKCCSPEKWVYYNYRIVVPLAKNSLIALLCTHATQTRCGLQSLPFKPPLMPLTPHLNPTDLSVPWRRQALSTSALSAFLPFSLLLPANSWAFGSNISPRKSPVTPGVDRVFSFLCSHNTLLLCFQTSCSRVLCASMCCCFFIFTQGYVVLIFVLFCF